MLAILHAMNMFNPIGDAINPIMRFISRIIPKWTGPTPAHVIIGKRARKRHSAQFLKTVSAGKHCDGARLWLVKRDDGGVQWLLRV